MKTLVDKIRRCGSATSEDLDQLLDLTERLALIAELACSTALKIQTAADNASVAAYTAEEDGRPFSFDFDKLAIDCHNLAVRILMEEQESGLDVRNYGALLDAVCTERRARVLPRI